MMTTMTMTAMIKIISKMISRFKKNKKAAIQQPVSNNEEVGEKISTINRELLNFKIEIEHEIELYVMNRYNEELSSKNLLN